MVTLTPITTPEKLQEYFDFRLRIYNESRLKGFVNEAVSSEKDEHDDRALHYGWYVDGTLAGCIRFVEADGSAKPTPLFGYMTDPEATAALHTYLAERRTNGERVIEASRFCLAPEHRGLRTAREFVLAMVMTMQPQGFEHGLFDCHATHAPFYRAVGFDAVGPRSSYATPVLGLSLAIFRYDFNTLLTRNKELLGRMGFTLGRGMRKAA